MRKLTKKHKQELAKPEYLKPLLRRFRAAARSGQTKLPCPLCMAMAKAPDGKCPVFECYSNGGCMNYMPPPPLDTSSGRYGISTRTDSWSAPDAIERTQAWAAKVVAMLEAVQAEVDSWTA